MRFRVLGPLTVVDRTGAHIHPRGQRLQVLLAMLLLNANHIVPTRALIDAMWPTSPPKSAAANLYTYVHRTRDLLGDIPIDNVDRGYRIRVHPTDLDLLVFRTETTLARQPGLPPHIAITHLHNALNQWRDNPLSGLSTPALTIQLAGLRAERLAAFEDRMALELALGRHSSVIGELELAVAHHPTRNRLTTHLTTALNHIGAPRRLINQLPADIPDLIGRDPEITNLTALLSHSPVAITGRPGTGKTTLAVRVAHRVANLYPDGQLFIPFGGSPDNVYRDVLTTLSVPAPAAIADQITMLRELLAHRKMLIVADNAADPDELAPFANCPLLVTSRWPLTGFLSLPLGPLSPPDAIGLLGGIIGPHRIAAEPVAAATITAYCEYLPLAIRMAGARLTLRPEQRLTGFAEVLADPVHRLDELRLGDLDLHSLVRLPRR